MLTIGVCSGKGGTAKTTSTVGLAWSLKAQGHRVLVVDLDPQGHATSCMGVDRIGLNATTGGVLMRTQTISDAILPTNWGIDLCPTNEGAGDVESDLSKEYYGHERLAGALAEVEGNYDVILIDCPPSLKILTANAIFAADWIISPTELSYLSYERILDLQAVSEKICERDGPPPLSVLVARYDGREKVLNELILKTLNDDGARLMGSMVPTSTKVKQAQSAGVAVQEFAPKSPAAVAFDALAKEISEVMEGGNRAAA